ncbi:NADAR family protein [Ralstonia insidiosa]|jgi:ribA/ribD-fused uncharacterized protein|nr:NADAR family protein [Ralstonia insidiosa]MBA9940430.1 NADAR family protein [Ralstonia insidiosa]MBC9968958.1 NADAR family protein [Ralstonia insidiosa]MBX3904998.1 NADAR family protein [Ralstonia insidiosa]
MHEIQGMTLFFGAEDALSNWHPAQFTYRGVEFTSVEQFMMYSKARLFSDDQTARKILSSREPREQKRLGREVRGFDEAVWITKRKPIVTVGCREKFWQNPLLGEVLLGTDDTLLVEASPYDRIYGVGLAWNDPRIRDVSQWQGLNLLGEVLMEVRSWLPKAGALAAGTATAHKTESFAGA